MSRYRPFLSSMFFQFFAISVVVSTVLYGVVFWVSLNSSVKAMTEQKSEDMTLLLERTGQYVDLYIQNIGQILFNLSQNVDFQNSTSEQIAAALENYSEANKGFVGMLFYMDAAQRIVSSNQVLYDVIGHPHLNRLFRAASENLTLLSWSEPYYSPLQTEDTIAFVRAIRSPSGETLGVLAMEINLQHLSNQISNFFPGSNQSFLIMTSEGNNVAFDRNSRLLPYQEGVYPREIADSFVRELFAMSKGTGEIPAKGATLTTVKVVSKLTGWYLIGLIDKRTYLQSANRLIVHFVQVGLVWLLLLLVVTFVLTKYFTTPIRKLALKMERVRQERMAPVFLEPAKFYEVSLLSKSFHTMMVQIQELIENVRRVEETKKKVELKLLLSQIRPHFLYNTLSGIGILAKQNRITEVQETIRSLILLLTYSINKKDEMITLKEELESLRAYIQIQKARYGDSFEWVEQVAPEYAGCYVPKLLLQPLVENAIFHGLAAKESGRIVARCRRDGEAIHLVIEDNGAGIADMERVNRLLEQPGVSEENPSKERFHMNSMGLSNVQERIKIQFGEPYGLHIESAAGRGTRVTATIPWLER